MKKDLLKEICAALILLLFIYSATSKLLDINRFVVTMSVAPLPIMRIVAPVLGWLIPIIETTIALSMLSAKSQMHGLLASAILLGIFEIYIASMLLSGLHLPCSCGGVISKLSWKQHLLFNLIFIVISITPFISGHINRDTKRKKLISIH